MLPALQFVIAMIACTINERVQRKLDYTQEKVRVLSLARSLSARRKTLLWRRIDRCGDGQGRGGTLMVAPVECPVK